MLLNPIEYLRHMRDEVDFILKESMGLSYEDFFGNAVLCKALCKSIEMVGEASKRIPDSLKSKYPKVEWKKIAGTRDKLVHDYFDIDYELLWDIVQNKLPELKIDIERIISEN